jgi:adenylate cyclase
MDGLGSADILMFEGFRFDRRGGCLFQSDLTGVATPVALGSRALRLLGLLVERQGELVTKDVIMEAVWPGRVVEEANLNVQISKLRHILDQNREQGSCIQTVPGRGYCFVVPVRRPDADAHPVIPAVSQGGALHSLSIVVLPFANLSESRKEQHFAEGITDDLTTDLSRISGSSVIARNTALAYTGKAIDAKQIGRELGVRYVLEGSVRRTGDQIRVNVQLIDAENGVHLWADRFDTDPASLTQAQDTITGRLARTVSREIVGAAAQRIGHETAQELSARDLVVSGWGFFHQPASVVSRREAQRAFEGALKIDPRSIDARIGLATILATNLSFEWSRSPERDEARAEQLLLEAIGSGASLSMAHYAMGILRRVQKRMNESRIELETAIALDSNNEHAVNQLGHTLLYLGQPQAAISLMDKAIRLNPQDARVYRFYYALGASHLLLGHTDEAIELLRKARAGNPRLHQIHLFLAGALGLRGDIDEAKAALSEALKLRPKVRSLARYRATVASASDPQYWALREKTVNIGLRRAGFPDE